MPNEPVGKVILTSENGVFGSYLTLRKYKNVDCGPFCEVISSTSHPRVRLGAFSTDLMSLLTSKQKPDDAYFALRFRKFLQRYFRVMIKRVLLG